MKLIRKLQSDGKKRAGIWGHKATMNFQRRLLQTRF